MNSKTILALFLCFLTAAIDCKPENELVYGTVIIAAIVGIGVYGLSRHTKQPAPTEQPAAHNDEQVLGQTPENKTTAEQAERDRLKLEEQRKAETRLALEQTETAKRMANEKAEKERQEAERKKKEEAQKLKEKLDQDTKAARDAADAKKAADAKAEQDRNKAAADADAKALKEKPKATAATSEQATRTEQNTFAWKKAESDKAKAARIAKEEADRAAQTPKKETTPKDNIKKWYMVPILEEFQDSY